MQRTGRRLRRIGAGIASLSIVFGAPAAAQNLPPILSGNGPSPRGEDRYLPDYSYAGYGFGVEELPRVERSVDVADYGAVPDDGKDDSAALKAAIAAAAEMGGPVRVQLAAGEYLLTEILWIEADGIVLSGMGMGEGGTRIHMLRPLAQVEDDGAFDEIKQYLVENDKRERQKAINLDVIFSPYSWTGGFIWTRFPGGRHATYLEELDRPPREMGTILSGKRGERTLRVAPGASVRPGDVVQIHWNNRAGENGPLIAEMYGDTDQPIGSRHWDNPDRALVRQATRIERVSGSQVTIADPLLLNVSSDVPATFVRWDHLTGVGIQDLALDFPANPYFGHHNEAGYNGVYFTGVYNGWIRNVRVTNADSGILTDDLANVTIANVVTDGDHKAHYAVHVGNVHNVLVDGLTVRNPTEHTLSINTQATKSVYKDAVAWHRPTLDQHAGANHQNLFDNVTVHIVPDRKAEDGSPMYNLYKAGGAGYWLPGHARYNTTWNLNVVVDGGVEPGQPVTILADSEGPDARIVGMHGNRELVLDHTPDPLVERMNEPVGAAPSLYEYQRQRRLEREGGR